jgi:hypothetical protein
MGMLITPMVATDAEGELEIMPKRHGQNSGWPGAAHPAQTERAILMNHCLRLPAEGDGQSDDKDGDRNPKGVPKIPSLPKTLGQAIQGNPFP